MKLPWKEVEAEVIKGRTNVKWLEEKLTTNVKWSEEELADKLEGIDLSFHAGPAYLSSRGLSNGSLSAASSTHVFPWWPVPADRQGPVKDWGLEIGVLHRASH